MSDAQPFIIGWKEWCQLPELGLPLIKAKIDTGARTSALHAFQIEPFKKNNTEYVRFCIHPIQKNNDIISQCTAEIIDRRMVTSSNGSQEQRYVINTPIMLGNTDHRWNIELTLSDREPLRFRMLLGREALIDNIIINPNRSFCAGQFSAQQVNAFYKN